jgi:hypothetical protein
MTKNLGKILNAFDFCSNIYGKSIVCYVREGNEKFACDNGSPLKNYISQEHAKDSLLLFEYYKNSPECMNEPLITSVSCGSYYGSLYIHTDPITKEEIYMSSSDINPITNMPEHIIHSLALGVIGNNCRAEVTSD